MDITIDKAGRIVLPKRIRERFDLRAGTKLELEERQEGLILKPAEQNPSMVRRNGVWVHLGKAPAGFRWNAIVDDEREERAKEVSGL